MARVSFVALYDNFSLGVRLMASLLRQRGHEASVVFFKLPGKHGIERPSPAPANYEIMQLARMYGYCYDVNPWTGDEAELLFQALDRRRPDIIGLSSRSLFDVQAVGLLAQMRRRFPGVLLVAGGFGPTLQPEVYLAQADAVVFGEGEAAILGLAQVADGLTDMASVPNLIYRQNGRTRSNAVGTLWADLDALPFPLLDPALVEYVEKGKCISEDPMGGTYYTMAGRGCVGTCSYCSAGRWGALYRSRGVALPMRRMRSVGNVVKELVAAREAGATFIQFLDSYFVGTNSYLMDFFARCQQEVRLPFQLNLHPAQVVRFPGLLEAAVRAGLDHVTMGVQHGHEEFCRRVYRRRIPNETIVQASRLYAQAGLRTLYHVIAGNPLETEDELERSVAFLASLPYTPGRDEITVFRLHLFPGSPLQDMIGNRMNGYDQGSAFRHAGLRYALRRMLDDGTYGAVLTDTAGDDDALALAVMDATAVRLRAEELPFLAPSELMADIQAAVLRQLAGKPFAVAGDSRLYAKRREQFQGHNCLGFLPVGPAGNGAAAGGGAFLDDLADLPEHAPVLVVSNRKKEALAALRGRYGSRFWMV